MRIKLLQSEVTFNLNDGSDVMKFVRQKGNPILDVTDRIGTFLTNNNYAEDMTNAPQDKSDELTGENHKKSTK